MNIKLKTNRNIGHSNKLPHSNNAPISRPNTPPTLSVIVELLSLVLRGRCVQSVMLLGYQTMYIFETTHLPCTTTTLRTSYRTK